MQKDAAQEIHHPKYQMAEYVFETPVRVWHWIHALSFLTLCVTGYFIGNPMQSAHGEASASFTMGNIRFIHFLAAYVFAIGFVFRMYWAIVGNKFAKEIFFLPIWDRKWWGELLHECKYYALIDSKIVKYPNHNALARTAMFLFNVLGTIFMILTGFALYAEGMGRDSGFDAWFGWVIPLIGDSERVHNWHHIGMWILFSMAMGHIYAAFRGDVMSRQAHSSTIISGYRMYKDDMP
jgi:Ni/Fe-hydrogenase 1 B-type cytochrome subunit